MLRRLIAAAALALPLPALAEGEVVYWPLVTDGTEYRRIAYPPQAGGLVVLADTTVVFDVRRADVNYWPITREHLSDVTRGSPVVAGTLEIVDEAGTVTGIVPEAYLLWYPEGVGAGLAEVVRGERAAQVYESYLAAARAAADALRDHQRLVAEHHAAVEAWLKIAATRPAQLPPPPPEFTIPEPEPYNAFATAPEAAPIVSLRPGRYTIRLRDPAGGLVPGTERHLTAFAPLTRGTGFVIRPGDRWTQPVISFSPEATVYATGRTDLYLQPVPVAKYVARDFTRLFRPQSHDVVDPFLTLWVPELSGVDPAADISLTLWNGTEQVGTRALAPFRVTQTTGRSLGYVIEEFRPGGGTLAPDFTAIKLDRGTALTRVALAGGGQLPDSERHIREVVPAAGWALFVPALLPLFLALNVKAVARRRRQSALKLAGAPGGAAPGVVRGKQG